MSSGYSQRFTTINDRRFRAVEDDQYTYTSDQSEYGDDNSDPEDSGWCPGVFKFQTKSVTSSQDVASQGIMEYADSCVAKIISLRENFDKTMSGYGFSKDPYSKKQVPLEAYNEVMKFVHDLERLFTEHVEGMPADEDEDWNKDLLKQDPKYRDDYFLWKLIESAGVRTGKLLDCFYIELQAENFPGTLQFRRFQFPDAGVRTALGPLALANVNWEEKEYEQLCAQNPANIRRDILSVTGVERKGSNSKLHVDPGADKFLEKLAPRKPTKGFWQVPTDPIKLREFEFRWMFFKTFVEALGPFEEGHDQGHMRRRQSYMDKDTDKYLTLLSGLLTALLAVDNEQHIFQKIPVQALSERCSNICRVQYGLQCGIALVALINLIVLTIAYNVSTQYLSCAHGPWNEGEVGSRSGYACLLVTICYYMLTLCVLIELFIQMVDIIVWKYEWLTLWNAIDLVLEGTSLFVVSVLFWYGQEAEAVSQICFPIVIMTRWLKFLLVFLYNDLIGRPVLPALLAALSKPSWALFSSIVMASVAATHGYLGFRVLENGQTLGWYSVWGIWRAFLRMNRVIMFQDADVDHLAGRREVLINETGTHYIDEEDSGAFELGSFAKPIEGIHLSTLAVLVIGVVLMNTYVGVLAEKYNEYNSWSYHYFHQYRAQFQVKALVRRKLWAERFNYWSDKWGLPCFSCMAKALSLKRVAFYRGRIQGAYQGMWIVGPPRYKTEVEEVAEVIDEVHEHVKDIVKESRDIETIKQDIAIMKAHILGHVPRQDPPLSAQSPYVIRPPMQAQPTAPVASTASFWPPQSTGSPQRFGSPQRRPF